MSQSDHWYALRTKERRAARQRFWTCVGIAIAGLIGLGITLRARANLDTLLRDPLQIMAREVTVHRSDDRDSYATHHIETTYYIDGKAYTHTSTEMDGSGHELGKPQVIPLYVDRTMPHLAVIPFEAEYLKRRYQIWFWICTLMLAAGIAGVWWFQQRWLKLKRSLKSGSKDITRPKSPA